VAAAIQDRRPGDGLEVRVLRGGDEQALDVRLAERPGTAP
jgi:S1-C subfamily serine protease